MDQSNQSKKENQPLTSALLYAERRDWLVFPAPLDQKKSHKAAEFSNGVNWGATNDPKQIRLDFTNPKWAKAGIGVPTGAVNRIVVLEADTKEGHPDLERDGEEVLRELNSPIPETLTAISPSGSRHRYFKYPSPGELAEYGISSIVSKPLLPGVDLKADGGMVLAPPTSTSKGRYEWEDPDQPIAQLPLWLLKRIADNQRRPEPPLNNAANENNPSPWRRWRIAEVELILAQVNPDLDRNSWFECGVVCFKLLGPVDGKELWVLWSKQGRKYSAGRSSDQCDGQWPTIRQKTYNFNLGSIYHFAEHFPRPFVAIGYAASLGEEADVLDDPELEKERQNDVVQFNDWLANRGSTKSDDSEKQGVNITDFYAYMPMHNYIFAPSREMWPGASVNSRFEPFVVAGRKKKITATYWIDNKQPVEMMTWAPGLPMIIKNRLISEGGWIKRKGVSTFNLYRPPAIELGDANRAGPWLDLVHKVFPNNADHLIQWFAHRRQYPDIKINHCLVLGSEQQGIGKDTILEPVKQAVGPWNFKESSPSDMFGNFNPWLRSVVLRINEAKDMGDVNRFEFYEHLKAYQASPPDVLRCNEKHIKEHYVLNCVGIVITTNHLTDGIYLPGEDRRHYVAWSDLTPADFSEDYWNKIYRWYGQGGDRDVAAYLHTLDISKFDPKAPPPKTPAFWQIVNANRTVEEGQLADAIDALGNPDALTISDIVNKVEDFEFNNWLRDNRNRKSLSHKLRACGYHAVNNPTAKSDGLWRVAGLRAVIYAKKELSFNAQIQAAERLQRERPAEKGKPKF